METRTKSANITLFRTTSRTLCPVRTAESYGKGGQGGFLNPPKNTEIAFSLSPQSITNNYEKGTASLEQKLNAIQKLLSL
jgi:hypothetical protein